MDQKLLTFIASQGLILPKEHVVVAVSGGADSMALLHALLRLQNRLGIKLSAAHFHHGLRGAEADRDAAFVAGWCAENGVACQLGRGDVRQRAEETGESLEEAARALRYTFFDGLKADKIATAHTMDDNAETVLLHLLRGTGLRGLGGIPARRDRYVRPLLGVTRAEIDAYLDKNGVPHVEDGTNQDDTCLRNRLRHRVLPLLLDENPSFLQTVSRTGAILRQEDAYLSSLALSASEACKDGEGWSCAALLSLPPVLRRRALLGMLEGCKLENPSSVHLESLEALLAAASPSAACTLPEGWAARREYDRLLLVKSSPAPVCPSRELKIPGVTDLSEIGLQIRAKVTENSNFSNKNNFTFAFRCDIVSPNAWTVRARQPGDTLRLPVGHRSVKRILIDRKIPANQRDALPVVLCEGQVAGVLGLAVSEDFTPVPGHPVLLLTCLPLQGTEL